MPKKQKLVTDLSTEEKIKEAAKKVFTKKGYAGTRTRDIAEESGINLALLNYYFRSKEKLFEIIMIEKVQKLFGVVTAVLNDDTTTIEKKINAITNNYIDMLTANPDLPLFVLSEIRSNPERFSNIVQAGKLMQSSHFVKQLKEKRPDMNPVQFLMSILGMTVFPFVGKPIFQASGVVNQQSFNILMEERKKLIPKWFKAILKTK